MKILLLEDTPAERSVVEEYLTLSDDASFEVATTADEFEQRLDKMIEDPASVPGVFVIDLGIDDQSDFGLQVLRRIRTAAELRHVPVVIVSQQKLDDVIFAAYSAGANSYIHKSIELDVYRERIHNVLKVWETDTKRPDSTRVSVDYEEDTAG